MRRVKIDIIGYCTIFVAKYVVVYVAPLSCHKRKMNVWRFVQSQASSSLIAKFRSLQLTTKHKICPSCRMKLYKLPDGTPLHRGFSGHRVVHSNNTMTASESDLVEDTNTAVATPDSRPPCL